MKKWIFIFCIAAVHVFAQASSCQKAFQNHSTTPTPDSSSPAISVFTQGLNEADSMIQLAEKLRSSKINTHSTHISDFETASLRHIDFMKKGFEKLKYGKEEKLKILADLRTEAEEKKASKQMTYTWWLLWNEKLTALASSIEDFERIIFRLEGDPFGCEPFIDTFPNIVLLPTIYGELGVQAINRLLSRRIFPLGILHQSTFIDGFEASPRDFFLHDVLHIYLAFNNKEKHIYNIEKVFYINFYQEMQKLDLSPEQQNRIDIIYFSIVHEQIMDILVENKSQTLFNLEITIDDTAIEAFQRKNLGSLRELLPADVNPNSRKEVEDYLNESRQLFIQLGIQILESKTALQLWKTALNNLFFENNRSFAHFKSRLDKK